MGYCPDNIMQEVHFSRRPTVSRSCRNKSSKQRDLSPIVSFTVQSISYPSIPDAFVHSHRRETFFRRRNFDPSFYFHHSDSCTFVRDRNHAHRAIFRPSHIVVDLEQPYYVRAYACACACARYSLASPPRLRYQKLHIRLLSSACAEFIRR